MTWLWVWIALNVGFVLGAWWKASRDYGRIDGNIGWCGQEGYWWVSPCPHYRTEGMTAGSGGCHWLDIDRIRKAAVLEYRLSLGEVDNHGH